MRAGLKVGVFWKGGRWGGEKFGWDEGIGGGTRWGGLPRSLSGSCACRHQAEAGVHGYC